MKKQMRATGIKNIHPSTTTIKYANSLPPLPQPWAGSTKVCSYKMTTATHTGVSYANA